MIEVEDELHRKALDTISSLLASSEAGRITAESFRVGIETVWGCLGGVVDTQAFHDLMRDANGEVRGLPIEPKLTVMNKGENVIVTIRVGEKVDQLIGVSKKGSCRSFDMDDQAIAFVQEFHQAASERGFKDLGVIGG